MDTQGMIDHFRLYVDDPSGDRWTNSDAMKFLSRGQDIAQHYVDQADQGYFSSCATYSVVATNDALEFDLPSDLKALTQVERVTSTEPVPAVITPFGSRHYFDRLEIARSSQARAPLYYLRGDKIGVVEPSDSYTLRVFYIKRLSDLVNTTDVSSIPAEFHGFIVLHAVKLAFGSEGRAWPAELAEEYEAQRGLLASFTPRQKQHPRYVRYVPYY